MINYTLNKEELLEYILVECFNYKDYEEEFFYLSANLERCKYWEIQISVLSHILSLVLEILQKRNLDSLKAIEFIYDISNTSSLLIQEGSINYIETLLVYDNRKRTRLQ